MWLLRDHAVRQLYIVLQEIAELDDGVEAHIDGLRIAGNDGWELCQQDLSWEEPGEIFTAAVLELESGDPSRIAKVFEVGCFAPELERGLISALGWTPNPNTTEHLVRLMASSEPAVRRVGIAACAIRRQDPGDRLAQVLADDDARVRSRSYKAVAELGRIDLLSLARRAMTDEDESARFWAAYSAARLSDRSEAVVNTLGDFVSQPGPFQERVLSMMVRIIELSSAKNWLGQLRQDAHWRRPATIGIGAFGDPELVDVLFKLMQLEDVARVAGEAFSMITGADLSYENLDQDQPAGFESGPTEDAADENVALDADENLPWPNRELVAKWWDSYCGNFQSGRRYLCGREIGIESLGETLLDGEWRQRAAAARELALLQPQQPLFEVRARGDWQKAWLKS